MIVAPGLGDHWIPAELLVSFCFVFGWTTILISALIGAGLGAVGSGIKQGIEGDFDAGQFFKDIGIGFGSGGLTAGLGSAIGSIGSSAASAGQSAATNAAGAAAPEIGKQAAVEAGKEIASEVPAALAEPGTFGATGIAAKEGAMTPIGASGALGGAESAQQVAQQATNAASEAIRSAQAPQMQSLLSQGNALAAASKPPMLGPSFPQFQQATSIARGQIPQAVDFGRMAAQAVPQASTAQNIARQAVVGSVVGAGRGFAEGRGDWRGPVYGALAGGVSAGVAPQASAALQPIVGRAGAQAATEAIRGGIGGAIRGLGTDDPGRGALAGGVAGALGGGATSGLTSGWNAITRDLMPLKEVDSWRGVPYSRDNDPATDFNNMLRNPYGPDHTPDTSLAMPRPNDPEWARAMGVSAMRALGNEAIGTGVGSASSAVYQALNRPRPVVPSSPTSGPAMYRSQRGVVPTWQPMRRFG